jgi:hypothetical protein
MAQRLVTDFITTSIPGAYAREIVSQQSSGISTTGVLMLVGEADAGPDVTAESDITANVYGPDALASVIAKYKSGPIVDAFKAVSAASNDPNITGSPTAVYIAKTNVSTKASGTLVRAGLSTSYGTLADKSYGALGNLIYASVSVSAAEVSPTTGSFTYIPTPQGSTLGLRVNGGATQSLTIGAKLAPSSLVGNVSTTANQSFNSLTVGGLNTIHATGGQNRTTINAIAGQLAVAASGATVVITVSGTTWNVTPSVGDTLIIPLNGEYGAAGDSPIKGAANANAGAYVVTAATTTTISATKLRNNAAGALTNPVNVGSTNVLAITDVLCYAPITVQNFTGTERSVLTGIVGQTVTGTASGQTLVLTLQTAAVWAGLPQAGDIAVITSGAPAGWLAAGSNGGWYQVTGATSSTAAGGSTITMTRLSNGAPASFVATAIGAVTDLRVFRPAIDGLGKSLEIFDGAGADTIVGQFYNLSTTQVSWISSGGSPQLLTSSAEYTSQLNVNRQVDNIQETFVGQPDIVLTLGYQGGGASGITGTVTISGTTLTTSVTGGNGTGLTIDLKQFSTLGDLATYISTQTGYVCAVGSALYGQLALTYIDNAGSYQTILDKGTYGIASQQGSYPGRIKRAAYALFSKVALGSTLVQFGATTALAPSAGQPEVQSNFFLSGAAKGFSTNARVTAAIDAMEKVRGNFLVTLFSRDASADIVDNLTDSSSTYTIDSINAYAKTHVLAMSDPKRRRRRQAFVSKKTSFTGAKLAAQNLATARCLMVFQDFKQVDSAGNLKQFPALDGRKPSCCNAGSWIL